MEALALVVELATVLCGFHQTYLVHLGQTYLGMLQVLMTTINVWSW